MCAICGCGGEGIEHRHDHSHDHSHDHAHSHDHDPHPRGQAPGAPARGEVVRMEQAVLAKNDGFAEQNRACFQQQGILALNLVSSPGAGKTTLLERTLRELARELPLGVIEGDQETDNDARRIRATGCRAVQINTGAGCHLDAQQVGAALRQLEPQPGSLLFIENVGNLVCPALFDLGERAKVVVLSVTEGEDKPTKYPYLFRAADVLVLSKTDLLPYLEFDVGLCAVNAHRVNPRLRIFPVSALTGAGLAPWYDWLRARSLSAKEAE